MSKQIDQLFNQYKKVFLSREDDLKIFAFKHFSNVFNDYKPVNVERMDASERIKISGFYKSISGWKNVREIVLSSCERVSGSQKRFDYYFIFSMDLIKRMGTISKVEPNDEEKADISDDENKEWKDFTEEEKEQYRLQKEKEKEEAYKIFEEYLEQQTFQDVIEKIESSNDLKDIRERALKIEERIANTEDEDKKEKLRELQRKHGYSVRNYLMVLSQARKREDSNFVGIINSYSNWMRLGAPVKKNPDKSQPYGFKILMPVFKKKKVAEGGSFLSGFKLGTVFDISQTVKYDEFLKESEVFMEEIELKDEISYKEALEFTEEKLSEINVNAEEVSENEKGEYNADTSEIKLHDKTSHSLFHQLGNHIVHSILNLAAEGENSEKINEILAEITCYLLMKKFEYGKQYKINYDFAFSNYWAFDILEVFKFRDFEKIYKKIVEYVHSI